ncbi:MAG: ABC transporter ATP-binding protein, partial [Peptostreptococcaceae bacterium]|nr:ABC transporter ATP-binding protein [Peptostreptococcaceae bacterium]
EEYEEVLTGAGLSIRRGEIVGLSGRSGSGKSTVAMAIIGLLEETGGKIKEGKITYTGKSGKVVEINNGSAREMEKLRGTEISLVFQNPGLALNPLVKIGRQLERCCPKEALDSILIAVGLEKDKKILNQYPHQLSIGMCQRITIALAIGSSPALLILDEPTASLDYSNKKKILDLLIRMNKEVGTSLLITTHDQEALEYLCCKEYSLKDGKILEKQV